jgi:hypothetical protein
MKFISRNAYPYHLSIQVQDYIDSAIFLSLAPQYQNFLTRLFDSESKHLGKFLSKLSSNQIFINADMLNKMLDKLFSQMTIPLQIFQKETFEADDDNYSSLSEQTIFNQNTWFFLLENLKIWSSFPLNQVAYFLKLADSHIKQDTYPVFQHLNQPNEPKKFWQKKIKKESYYHEIAFKFFYDKLKYFHTDLLENAKRPMDLFELFCLIEDAAIEKNLIQLNEEHICFLRSLNASSLLYSVINDFPAALPDYIARYIEAQSSALSTPLWEQIKQHPQFEPFYGTHPFLKDLNSYGFYLTLKDFIDQQIPYHLREQQDVHVEVIHEVLNNLHHSDDKIQYFQQHTNRLIFMFNRLTSLGFLMRSPYLKGLGYHPLINTDTPIRFANHLQIFMNLYSHTTTDQQYQIIHQLLEYAKPQQDLNLSDEYENMCLKL